jgi:hypothetical protein
MRLLQVDCAVSEWAAWTQCDAATKQWKRARSIVAQPEGGKACPPLEEASACSVDCAVGVWSEWTPCDAAAGRKTRRRGIVTPPRNGAKCPALADVADCGVACVLALWEPWGECSAACGGGRRTRRRTVEVSAMNGGAPCGSTEEADGCNAGGCEMQARAACRWMLVIH